MNITDIKQQVKTQGRYSIFIDGKYSFALGEQELMNSGLRIGREINQTELDELKDTAKLDKAYWRALNLLARRQRSEWELRDYLKRKDYTEDEATPVINKLAERGYLDDLAFARAWVSNRRLLKPTSKRKLTMELKQKRVAEDIIKQVLEEDETDEREVLKELIERKRKQSKYQDNLKLMQYLARQGYNYDDIKAALSEE